MKLFFFVLLLTCFPLFSQKLEEKIYKSVDELVAHPTQENIEKLTVFEKSIDPKTDAELLAFVILNCNKAYFQNQFGNTKNAILSYEKGWQTFDKNKLQNYDIIEFCLKPLGNLYTIIGDFENAENIIKHYLFIANTQNNPTQKISAIQNLANIYQSSGKNNLAINLLQKTIATDKISIVQKGVLLNNLGASYLIAKNYTSAKFVLQQAIQLLQNNKNQAETLSNAYRNLAIIFNLEGDYIKTNSYFKKSKSLFFSTLNFEPRKAAKLYLDEATILFQEQNFGESEKSIQNIFTVLLPNYKTKDTLPKKNSLYAETILIDAFNLQAEIYLLQKQPKKALQCYNLSFYIDDLLQTMLIYENSKIISQISYRNRTEKCLEIYYSLFNVEKKSSYVESAFQLAEKTKALVLKSTLQDSKTTSKVQKLALEQLQNQNTIIVKEQQKGNLANLEFINKAIKKQNEIMLFLKSNNKENTNTLNKNLNLKLLFETINKNDAVLVAYFSGNQKIYSFEFENKQLTMQSFDYSTKSKQKIISFLNYFSDADKITNNVLGYNNSANELYTFLKLPKKTKAKNLIIIADGLLNFVPFEALITKKNATTNFSKMHYLINDFNVAYNSSVLLYLNAKSAQKNKETVLGVFPIFENTNLELTYSKEELKAIKQHFNGKYLENNQATFANFSQFANQYSILHLSTHASSGDPNTPATIRFYDQEILYSELYNLNIKPNLVVLSACETGLGKLYKAEGAMSVSRGFQMAGAQNLLFSLWKVNDYTTSKFMEKFYKNLESNNSYFEANHKAKLDFLNDETISNSKKSPYYWCAMVYYGEVKNSTLINWWFLIGFAVLGFIVFILIKKFLFFASKNKQSRHY